MKRKILTIFLVALSMGCYSQELTEYKVVRGPRPVINLDKVPSDAYETGIIKIKFTASAKKSLPVTKMWTKGSKGYVETGIKSLDRLNKKFGASVYKPLLHDLYSTKSSDVEQYKARHAAWGFDRWYYVELNTKADVIEAVKQYRGAKDGVVEFAEPVYKIKRYDNVAPKTDGTKSGGTLEPNDPRYNEQWHYNNTGQTGGTQDADIDLPEAWTLERGYDKVIVAVVDGGIQTNHPDLKGNLWASKGYNFINNNTNIQADDHGCHTAGTIAAVSNNNLGVSGIAGGTGTGDGVRLMSCQVFHGNSANGFEQAPIWAADHGAAISQNSWGNTKAGVYSQSILDAIDYFNTNGGGEVLDGGVTIFAAGNDGSTGDWYPGCYQGAYSVAATNHKDVKSGYSNYGAWVDISAPGGEQSYQGDSKGVLSTVSGSGYDFFQGTSMACPHVSGVAALAVSYAYRNGLKLSNKQLLELLSKNVDNHYGKNSGYQGKLGSGRLNAYLVLKAVQQLLGGSTLPKPDMPTGLKTSNITTSTALVSWNAVEGATSYTLKIGDKKKDFTTTSSTLTNLQPNSSYTWQVCANNSAGSSAYASQSFSTPEETEPDPEPDPDPVPNMPTGLKTTNITTNSATLSWNAVSGATSYTVQSGTISKDFTKTTCNFTGLSANTTYTWQVRANNASGSSQFASQSFTTLSETQPDPEPEPDPVPDMPTGLTTTDITSSTALVSWNPVSGATSYTVKVGEIEKDFTKTSSTLTNLQPSTTYTWQVRANNASGSSPYASMTFTSAPEATPEPPATGSSLPFSESFATSTLPTGWTTQNTGSGISERWSMSNTAKAGGTAYELRCSYQYVNPGTTRLITPAINTKDVDKVSLSFKHFYDGYSTGATIKVQTSNDLTTWEDADWSINTTSTDIPASTVKVDIDTKGEITYFALVISGNLYQINYWYVDDVSIVQSTNAPEPPQPPTPPVTVEYCTSKATSTYYEWIDLVQFAGINRSSGNDGGYIDMTALQATVTPGSTERFIMSTGYANSAYTEYWGVWIDYNQDGIFDDSEKIIQGSTNSAGNYYADITIPSDAKLGVTRMRVSMKYNNMQTACEVFADGEVEDYSVNIVDNANSYGSYTTLSGNEFAQELGYAPEQRITVYPNPATSQIKVAIDGNDFSMPVSVYDIQGRLVLRQPSNGSLTEINIDQLSKGIYFLTVEDEREPFTQKFVKN